MLQDLYAKAVSTNADVVFCDYYVESNGNSVYRKQEPPSFSPEWYFALCFSGYMAVVGTSLYDDHVIVNMDVIFQKG